MGSFISNLNNIKNLFTDPKNNWRQLILCCIPILFLLIKNIFNPIICIFLLIILTIFIINIFNYVLCSQSKDSQNNNYSLNINDSLKNSLLICVPLIIYLIAYFIIVLIPNKLVLIVYYAFSIIIGFSIVTLFNNYSGIQNCRIK